MFLHKTLSETSLLKTGNTVFTLPWESRALGPGEGPPRPLQRPTLPAAREGDVVGKRYVNVFIHDFLLKKRVTAH